MISESRTEIAGECCVFVSIGKARGYQPLLVELETPRQLAAELHTHVLCIQIAEFRPEGVEQQHALRRLCVRRDGYGEREEKPADHSQAKRRHRALPGPPRSLPEPAHRVTPAKPAS